MVNIYKILTIAFALILVSGVGVYALNQASIGGCLPIDGYCDDLRSAEGGGGASLDSYTCPSGTCTSGDTFCFENGAGGQLCTCGSGGAWAGPTGCGGRTSSCDPAGLGGKCKIA